MQDFNLIAYGTDSYKNMLEPVFENGSLIRRQSLTEIRQRAAL